MTSHLRSRTADETLAVGGQQNVSATLRRRRRPGNPNAIWREFLRRPTTYIFLPILVVMAIVSFVGPAFVGDPVAAQYSPLLAPGADFLLGTDQLGRDYLARVVYGGQTSLLVGFSIALLCMTIGVVFGALAGFYGGVIDFVLVKIIEFFQVLPGLILALVSAALLGSSVGIIIAILAITMWPQVARIVRGETMRVAELGYVESARASGFSSLRILWSEVLPNAMPPVLAATTMTVGRAILVESGLAFLGIGDQNRPSWGALLNTAQSFIGQGWWLAFFPGACIFIVVLAVNMLGDALNDSLNPSIGRVK